MKHLFTAAAMLFSMTAFAQVGINNTSPKATLDITAKTTDGSKPEGLIIPQLSGSNIHTATAAGVYGINQKGLIIYATSADSSPTSATTNITAAGYYYFDGTNWQKIITGSVANADLTTETGGIYKGSGALSGNTTVTQGANTLAFTSTATNGFSVDGTTLSVDAANNRVGIGTSTPAVALDINSSTSGAIKIKDGTEADGKVLVSDANGVGTWKNPSSTSGTLIYSGAVTTRYVPGSTYIRVDLGSVPANVWDKVYNAAGRAYIIAKNIALGYIHQTTVWAIGDRNNFQTYGFFFNDVYWSTFNSSTSTWQYQASRAPLPDFIEIYIF